MYIVKKKIKGREYYYLNKSIRKGDKVTSKNIAYLGKNKKEAEKKAKEIIAKEKMGEKEISKINKPQIEVKDMVNKPKELNIIDEKGSIIGKESRDKIHRGGLLHREINVFVYNDEEEILFQKRAPNKDTFPSLFDASAGGHVDIGEDYLSAAIRELEEETGIKAKKSDLILLGLFKKEAYDKVTNKTNYALKEIYAYHFKGKEELAIEKGEATNLKFWPIKKLFNLSKEEEKEFIPTLLSKDYLNFYKKIEEQKESKKLDNNKASSILTIEELANFCKKKGFVFRSSEIYGGLGGFWDFGPLGVELFNNIKQDWWNYFVKSRKNMVGMEASIISHPKTWEASGHLQNFNDIFVKCKKCGKVGKLDENELGKVKCECGGEYESQGKFNLMFETKIGSTEPMTAYLRGETAQAMFMDFKLIQQVSRQKLPFGIAQIGRCFRNEISPRDFLFRSREFHIGELEFFINPEEEKCNLLEKKQLDVKVRLLDSETHKKRGGKLRDTTIKEMLKEKRLGEWHAYWLAEQVLWFESIGLKEIKIREHTKDELSHYSSATFDIDYEYVFGSKEIAGNADRGQYDLTQHAKFSKESLEVFDESTGKKVIPKVIEPTFGIERVFLAILTKAYGYDKERQNIVLKIPAKLAPIKAAVFPIVKQPEYEKISEEIINDLKKEFNVVYDGGGSIGRRYARADESGTPMCIAVDEQSLKDDTATIRWRDNAEQVRVKISELRDILRKVINEGVDLFKFGKKVNTRVK